MEKCRISKDMLMGHVCRGIPGAEKGSCFLWQAAQLETAQTMGDLKVVIEYHPECLFQQEVLDYIEQRKKNNEKC